MTFSNVSEQIGKSRIFTNTQPAFLDTVYGMQFGDFRYSTYALCMVGGCDIDSEEETNLNIQQLPVTVYINTGVLELAGIMGTVFMLDVSIGTVCTLFPF